jgi:hypothetical protein
MRPFPKEVRVPRTFPGPPHTLGAVGTSGERLTPGWLPDPENTDLERLRDGEEWTAKSRPAPLLKFPPPLMPEPRRRGPRIEPSSGVDAAGYIFAVLMPLVGFVIGLTQINRSQHGIRVVCLAVGMFLFYTLLFFQTAG